MDALGGLHFGTRRLSLHVEEPVISWVDGNFSLMKNMLHESEEVLPGHAGRAKVVIEHLRQLLGFLEDVKFSFHIKDFTP